MIHGVKDTVIPSTNSQVGSCCVNISFLYADRHKALFKAIGPGPTRANSRLYHVEIPSEGHKYTRLVSLQAMATFITSGHGEVLEEIRKLVNREEV